MALSFNFSANNPSAGLFTNSSSLLSSDGDDTETTGSVGCLFSSDVFSSSSNAFVAANNSTETMGSVACNGVETMGTAAFAGGAIGSGFAGASAGGSCGGDSGGFVC